MNGTRAISEDYFVSLLILEHYTILMATHDCREAFQVSCRYWCVFFWASTKKAYIILSKKGLCVLGRDILYSK